MDSFDPNALKFETAINAIFMLYKRAHYEEMRRIGMSKDSYLPVLQDFDMKRRGVKGSLTKADILMLVKMYPPIIDAAVRLIGVYMVLWPYYIQQHIRRLHG